jgi:suppressor for copper-sensitivity B
MACFALAVSLAVRFLRNRPPDWAHYTPVALQTALEQDKSVLITLYANWDPVCLVHEQIAINSVDAHRFIRDNGLTTLRADATNVDPAVMQLMKDNGLRSIPAFLIYSPAFPNEPIVLNDLVSEEQLLEAIRSNSERSKRK